MLRGGVLYCRAWRWTALGLATIFPITSLSGTADARRGRHRPQPAESYQPAYASIVVDANSGSVMQATNADSQRHPASLTKIMTLYLLFERLDQGKIKLNTDLPVSARGSPQTPPPLSFHPPHTRPLHTT